MIKNYFKIAFRNLVRHKAYSTINIAGLAIGMTCSIFILLWVRDELSYDRFHPDADRIYRITCDASGFKAAVNPYGMPEGLKGQLPQVSDFVRISHLSSELFSVGEKKFMEKDRVFYVDSNFLQFFYFPLIKGDGRTALASSENLLISETIAIKYFGTTDVIGKTLVTGNTHNHTITGVLKNIPGNSHLQFDFLMPLSFIGNNWDDIKYKTWGSFNFYSYLKMKRSFDPSTSSLAKFAREMDAIYITHIKELKVNFFLQPLAEIHLHPVAQVELPGGGNVQYVNIFFIVAIFILVVACINFMNLATARSARRAKEVGLRKVVGAGRFQLIGQFLGESMIIALLAFCLAFITVILLIPSFNQLSGKSLSFHLFDPGLLILLLGIAVGTGLLAGIYPALFLSGFKPVMVLKGKLKSVGGNLAFRNILVITQFVVSIVLLVGTVVVYKQLKYIRDRNLGFDKENLLYIETSGELWDKKDALKAALAGNPNTSQFTLIDHIPTNLISGSPNVVWEGKDPKTQIIFPSMDVDENFVDVFKMKILSGRSFSKEFKADSNNYLINETMAKVMGIKPENAVGKALSFGDQKGSIIGVVKDFNYKPIQNPIEPMVIRLNREAGYAIIRTKPGATEAAINSLAKIAKTINPGYPFEYGFLDHDLSNQYQAEQKMGTLFNIFGALAIFISCLGLYGLSAFMAEQRTKEIGVRKVLGASTFSILYLLSTNFTRLILIAVIIAVPISWYVTKTWLDGFAYRIELNWIVFVVASLSALMIAWATVSYESMKAAVANPAKSLRSE